MPAKRQVADKTMLALLVAGLTEQGGLWTVQVLPNGPPVARSREDGLEGVIVEYANPS